MRDLSTAEVEREIRGSVRAVSGEWKDESWCQAEQTEENIDKSHPIKTAS
jgi:hypothetical protein